MYEHHNRSCFLYVPCSALATHNPWPCITSLSTWPNLSVAFMSSCNAIFWSIKGVHCSDIQLRIFLGKNLFPQYILLPTTSTIVKEMICKLILMYLIHMRHVIMMPYKYNDKISLCSFVEIRSWCRESSVRSRGSRWSLPVELHWSIWVRPAV